MLINIILITLASQLLRSPAAEANGGKWQLLRKNIGVSAMHMQLLNNDRLVFFDRTDFGQSNLSLPAGKCRRLVGGKSDCTAHSAEYDTASDTLRPLSVVTDVWCSSGGVMPDGTLAQTGGFNDGDRVVRRFTPCSGDANDCDWREVRLGLSAERWYATNHILPDGSGGGGRQIIIGGRKQFNYEYLPKPTTTKNTLFQLSFLSETNDKKIENNLYPFVFLLPDGNLFIFANNRAVLLNYTQNRVVRTYPTIPGGDPRSYPSTGSAVLLPLNLNTNTAVIEAEVLVCGGAPKGSYVQALDGTKFVKALKTCARIRASDPKPKWVVETMPMGRTMGDMVTLPNGHVLIINGAGSGTAGWESARDPILNPVLYRPDGKVGSRFEVQNPTKTPRMYHSSAVLLRDGRVVVGGSNPNSRYNFTALFPTELSLEAFRPDYMDAKFGDVRPKIVLPLSHAKFKYAQKLAVRFRIRGRVAAESVKVTMVFPSFATHSFSMNQRLLVLPMSKVRGLGKKTSQVDVTMPGSPNLAPSGYYMLFVVHQGIPSHGVWVHIS